MIERPRGEFIIAEDVKTELKRYLLGQLAEPDAERLEMRLLTEPAFVEEFDVMVDDITASYVAGKFAGEEKKQVEQYFFESPERRKKLEFMGELLHQIGAVQEEPVGSVRHDTRPGFVERVGRFFSSASFAPRFATVAMAIVLLVVGGVWLSRSVGPARTGYVAMTLAISDAERGAGPTPEIKLIKLPDNVNELRLELLLPNEPTQPVRYRADFAPPANVRGLTITGQDSRAVVIAVPASALKPDRYAVRLFMIHADGREERVPGNYFFRVE